MTICTCGRPFNHCKSCGFKAVYRAKIKSMSRTMILGRTVDVFTCPRCGSDTDDTVECTAGSHKLRRVEFVLEDTSKRPSPTSPEYVVAASLRLAELKEAGLNDEKAVFRMKSEGWVITTDEEEPKPPIEVSVVETEPTTEITMDDVMAKMKEQSDRDAKRDTNIDLNAILERMRKK